MKRFSVNYASKVPVYKQLVGHYESMIKSGVYKVGQTLPSMNELSGSLDISKETVKKAYSVLRDKGYVEAKQGKGFYVAPQSADRKLTVLVLFDKLSQYKQVLFDSFTERMGDEAEITIRLHNQSVDLLEYYINENLDNYDYYIITPHFPLDEKIQKRALKLLGRIPNRKLILVDRYLKDLPGNYGAVYQDFENDIYEDSEGSAGANNPDETASTVTLEEALQRQQAKELRKALSLNDRFRFRRELFGNSDIRMNETLALIDAMNSYEEAEDYILNDLNWDEENTEVAEFMKIVQKHFL